jgi:hypothetical protein
MAATWKSAGGMGVEAFSVGEEDAGAEGEEHDGDGGGSRKEEERFLSAQADAFAGANAEEKIGLLRSK